MPGPRRWRFNADVIFYWLAAHRPPPPPHPASPPTPTYPFFQPRMGTAAIKLPPCGLWRLSPMNAGAATRGQRLYLLPAGARTGRLTFDPCAQTNSQPCTHTGPSVPTCVVSGMRKAHLSLASWQMQRCTCAMQSSAGRVAHHLHFVLLPAHQHAAFTKHKLQSHFLLSLFINYLLFFFARCSWP